MSELENCTMGAGASRIKKHLELNNAIESINGVREKVDDLLSMIINRSEPCTEKLDFQKETETEPSLEEVLNVSPEKIYKVCDEIYKIIEDIKKRIF